MANQEQLAILRQGVEIWNEWRNENPNATIDLQGASFRENNLNRVNLSRANLWKADFRRADLRLAAFSEAYLCEVRFWQADLNHAKFQKADLRYAELDEAKIGGASFLEADLIEANLSKAILREADFNLAHLMNANLREADLSKANLIGTVLSGVDLKLSDFSGATADATIFGNSDLSESIGLEDINHYGPSHISTDTFTCSKGKIPEVFLRGCGLSDWEIESVKLYNPDLSNDEFIDIQNRIFDLRNRQALQISPLFISYSHADGTFVDKLEGQLNKKGIRFWRDVHDATAGRLEKVIDRAIRLNPTVVLVLSEHSIKSDWVEHEVRTARELEKEMGRDVLCPVALDDSWKSSPWPKRVMEQVMEYNILDFSAWEDDSKFGNMFRKLIGGLELFYKG